ncbi:MAG TPA: hypothetical protein VER96_29755 [Polyangiaceae bacterium]|nr:hypothetical protein [Polyangiaceae bacterium]
MPPISELLPKLAAAGIAAVLVAVAGSARAAGKQGEFIQTDTLGMQLVLRDLDHHTTRTVKDVVNLSEFIGLHGYVVDRLRIGANFQLTERLWPEPPPGGRIQRLAVLPQIGWNFYDPFFTALVFGFAPRTDGKVHLNLSLQAVLGVSLPISKRVRLSVAGEVPWTFYDRHLVGFTALTGIAIRL